MAAQETRVDLREVVRLVNLARQAMGRTRISALRKGRTNDAYDCPLARSLDGGSVAVSGDLITFAMPADASAVADAWGVECYSSDIQTPPMLEAFVEQFDHHKFPQLELAD